MKAFLKPLQSLSAYEELRGKLKKNQGVLQLSGCIDSQKAHMAWGLTWDIPFRVILTYSEQKAKEIYEDCRYFDPQAVLYQAKDFLFFHADIQGNLLVQQRIRALEALLTHQALTVITTFDGCMDQLKPLSRVKEELLCIGTESVVEIKALSQRLIGLGLSLIHI